jgi:selT/selW/selH-like putative selenoprotein
LAGVLSERFGGIETELIEGSGGAFEVRRDGELIFSKHKTGRFPEDEEIFEAVEG